MWTAVQHSRCHVVMWHHSPPQFTETRCYNRLWVKCRTAECGMQKVKWGMKKKERRWYGSQIRPCDCSCYAVYHTPRVAGAAVNCIMQMWKFYACYPNFDLSFAINWKVLRNDTNKNYYCCVWRYCRYSQGLQSIIHHAKGSFSSCLLVSIS